MSNLIINVRQFWKYEEALGRSVGKPLIMSTLDTSTDPTLSLSLSINLLHQFRFISFDFEEEEA